ncbi:hypothetical protein BN406_04127 (plasmid) [Sinorhizobium meliloti Rm41]|nr:hypothetical protein BN406_04127 [Sinorhizobium meliloti Rm41]
MRPLRNAWRSAGFLYPKSAPPKGKASRVRCRTIEHTCRMQHSAGFRSDIAVHPEAMVGLELKDIVRSVAEQHERDPRQPIEAGGQAILAVVDLLRDGLGVALVGPAVKVPDVPVNRGTSPFHGSALTASGSLTKSEQSRPAARHQLRNWR